MRSKRNSSATVLFAAVATVIMLGAATHPEATLRSPVSTVAAGSAMPLFGEEFEENQTVKLVLRGALAEYQLPEVQADAEGKVSVELRIPPEVRPGGYRLVSIADDGDVQASLELTVGPAATGAVDHEGMDHEMATAGGATHEGMATEARADALPIERSRSGMEWGILGLLIGFAGGFGLSLVRVGERGKVREPVRLGATASAMDSD